MSVSLPPEKLQILREEIVDLNDRLLTQSINISGQAFFNAFKLGVGLLFIPWLIVMIVTYLQDRMDASSIFVYSCTVVMIASVFASMIARRAKTLAVQDNYQLDINPDIVRFLSEHDLTRQQFDVHADEILDPDAPLRDYLIKPSTDT